MRRYTRFAVIFCMAACASVGCGNGEATSSANKVESVRDADGRTPFDVLHGAVTAANRGDFAGAEKFILPNSVMGTNEVGVNVMPQKWPPFTHNGNISRLEFLGEEYKRNEVYVNYRVHYNDGSTFEDRATIKRVSDRWKITFMTHVNMF